MNSVISPDCVMFGLPNDKEDRYCNQEIAQGYKILAMNINKTSSKDDVIFFVGK